MSPSYCMTIVTNATMFFVGDSENPDYMPFYHANNAYGVRPEISLSIS